MKRKLFLLLCALLTTVGTWADFAFEPSSYDLTGRGASDWTSITPTVPSAIAGRGAFEVAVNNTDSKVLVYGWSTTNTGIKADWDDCNMAVRNLHKGNQVRLYTDDQSKFTLVTTAGVSQTVSGNTIILTVNADNVDMVEVKAKKDKLISKVEILDTYYLYEASTQTFLGRGNAWGTEASMDKYGTPFWLGKSGSNYFIEFIDWPGVYLFRTGTSSIYTDNTSTGWNFVETTGGYILKADDNTFVTHSSGGFGEYVHTTATQGAGTVWTIQTVSQHDAIVNAYPTNNKNNVITASGISTTAANFETYLLNNYTAVDRTSAIGTATFGDNAGSWTYSEVRGQTDYPKYTGGYARLLNATGTYTQTISANLLPAGIYKVKMAAFDRRGTNNVDNRVAAYGSLSASYLKVNNEQVRVKSWKEMFDAAGKDDSWAGQKASMDEGYADNVVYVYLDGRTDLTLTVGKPNYCDNSYLCFGGFELTSYVNSDAVDENKQVIIDNKGDITSLINGTFDDNANGWSNGDYVTGLGRNWRGSNINAFYERKSSGTMTTTVNNLPAGTYKVVAAARSYSGGKIKARVAAGEYGAELTGTGDATPTEGTMEINTNGVEIPYSSLGGFTTDNFGHNWHWISATGTLAADGGLVISFTTTGNAWMAIDDVHLYCTNLDETSYTKTLPTISENTDLSSYADGSVITCDIVMSNPNAIIYSTGANNITTAAGASLNNFMYKKSGMGGLYNADNVVLYDGKEFSLPGNSKGHYFASARLYRKFTEDTWCTLVVPFWPTDVRFTKKYPSKLNNGVLTFSDATDATWTTSINDKPMLVKCSESAKYIDGNRRGTANSKQAVSGDMISGEGAPMQGVYVSGTVPESGVSATNYVVSGNNLYKVDSEVSIKPFRAYFTVAGELGARLTLRFDDTTAINAIEAAEVEDGALKDGKYIIDNKIVIVKNGVKYSANGQILK